MLAALFLLTATPSFDSIWSVAVGKGFVGGAIVTDDQRSLFQKVSASNAKPFRVSGDTEIPICSITKLMTAQVILFLSKEKNFSLDDPVSKFLPWIPTFAKEITIRQLLTHTSGLRNMDATLPKRKDGVAPVYFSTDARLKNHRELVTFVIGTGLEHPSGSNYDYNNADFLVLAAVAESVTGKPFSEVLQQMIFAPAGMKHTRCAEWGEKPGHFVGSYEMRTKKPVAETRFNFAIYLGAGNVISTPNDMAKWARWELGLPSSMSVLATGSQFSGFQGLGCYAYDRKLFATSEPVVERPGAIANYVWQVSFLPGRKLAVLTYSNLGGIKLGSVFEGGGLTFDLMKAAVKQ